MENYFGMDSFSRGSTEAETVYCVNNMRSRGIGGQSANVDVDVAPVKYLSLDGLTTYHNLSQEQIKKLEERIAALEKKVFPISSAFVAGRLKRADLNLVFGK